MDYTYIIIILYINKQRINLKPFGDKSYTNL